MPVCYVEQWFAESWITLPVASILGDRYRLFMGKEACRLYGESYPQICG